MAYTRPTLTLIGHAAGIVHGSVPACPFNNDNPWCPTLHWYCLPCEPLGEW